VAAVGAVAVAAVDLVVVVAAEVAAAGIDYLIVGAGARETARPRPRSEGYAFADFDGI
jgi:hypothetical protein